jgi:predicted DNA-binding protein
MPYATGMRKTSVYLDDDLADRLVRLAQTEGRSQAEIIREAIAVYEPSPPNDRDFALAGCVVGPGDSVADVDIDALMSGFGE